MGLCGEHLNVYLPCLYVTRLDLEDVCYIKVIQLDISSLRSRWARAGGGRRRRGCQVGGRCHLPDGAGAPTQGDL